VHARTGRSRCGENSGRWVLDLALSEPVKSPHAQSSNQFMNVRSLYSSHRGSGSPPSRSKYLEQIASATRTPGSHPGITNGEVETGRDGRAGTFDRPVYHEYIVRTEGTLRRDGGRRAHRPWVRGGKRKRVLRGGSSVGTGIAVENQARRSRYPRDHTQTPVQSSFSLVKLFGPRYSMSACQSVILLMRNRRAIRKRPILPTISPDYCVEVRSSRLLLFSVFSIFAVGEPKHVLSFDVEFPPVMNKSDFFHLLGSKLEPVDQHDKPVSRHVEMGPTSFELILCCKLYHDEVVCCICKCCQCHRISPMTPAITALTVPGAYGLNVLLLSGTVRIYKIVPARKDTPHCAFV
jgi:guanyl-specific ribonuclease Sa